MKKEKPTTKLCKYCQTEIPYDAKICPQCRHKLKGGKLKWIVIGIIAIMIIGSLAGGSSTDTTEKIGEVSKEDTNSDSVNETTMDNAEQAEQEDVKTVYHVGDILKDGDMQIVYMSSGEHTTDNEFLQPAEGNKYIYIQLAFENTSADTDLAVSSFSFECYADGYNSEAYYGEDDTLSSTLSPGRSASGYLYFEVPEDAENIEIEYETNFFTEKKVTFAFDGDQDSGYVLEGNSTATEGAAHVGETVESKQLNITYISCFRDESDNMFIEPKDGYHFVTCEFEFENVSDSDESVSMYDFDCYADGIDCQASYFRDDNISATLSAGRKAKGTVTFEVPDDAQVVEVEYVSNIWTSDRVVFSVEE